jgi:predicted deacetylase
MLLVSIHDVTPAFESKVKKLWDLCVQSRVAPALLVVPNWHDQWPLEQYPGFVSWLRARVVVDGAELVLHGERHDETGLPRGLSDAWKAWGQTDREGEFLTLDGPAASNRIVRGLSRLRDLGLEPIGFVPPAWLARESLPSAVAAAGLAFTEDARSIRLLPSGERVPSPVVRWSSRTPLRAWGSAAVAAARWRLQRGSAWPRLALHPQDLDHGVTARSLARALDLWIGRHSTGRYADLCAALQPA